MFARTPAGRQTPPFARSPPATFVTIWLIFSSVLKTSGAERDGSKARDVSKELLRSLGDVITLVEPRLLELWKSTNLTFSQRRLLGRLRQGPRTAGALAEELDVHAPTLTRQLAKLEAHGLISREIDTHDRRRVLVTMTGAGRRAWAGHRVLGDSVLAAAARDLTPDQGSELVDGLRLLIGHARARQEASHE